ncbi:MAG: tetratricopeptide repeat protein [Elusimicrobia bacterium]|nr:tetratricopeptide repeat protein [Elusimicrobiota bacterium]
MRKTGRCIAILAALGAASTAVLSANITGILEQAQSAYNERANPSRVREAIVLWQEILQTEPVHYEALWRLAKAHWWLGDHSAEPEQKPIFEKAMEYGQKAAELYPDGVEGRYWYGVSVGRYVETLGPFNLSKLSLARTVKTEMETVLKLDPQHAGARHVLSVVYRKVPGKPFAFGSKKKALKYAEEAVELDPASLRYRIGLAEVLIALKRKDKARAALQEVLVMPPHPEYGPESIEEKDRASKLLQEI